MKARLLRPIEDLPYGVIFVNSFVLPLPGVLLKLR